MPYLWHVADPLEVIELLPQLILQNEPPVTIMKTGWEEFVVICPVVRECFVNGLLMPAGIRVLRDKDEITLRHGGRYYFSSERRAKCVVFARQDNTPAPVCPRCKQTIQPGQLAVRCPQCDLWHHQSDQWPCWTYAAKCSGCSHPTALKNSWQWIPEVF